MRFIYKNVYFIDLYKTKSAPVVLFGAGNLGVEIAETFRGLNIPIEYFCDNNEKKINTTINGIKCISINELKEKYEFVYIIIASRNYNIILSIIKQLQESAINADVFVNVIFLDAAPDKHSYLLENVNTRSDLKSINEIYSYTHNKIPKDVLPQYINDVDVTPYAYIYEEKILNEDFKSKYLNTTNGIRKTVNSPDYYENEIFVFGDSRCYGTMVEDSHTIESFLQSFINGSELKYRVNNLACPGESIQSSLKKLKHIELKESDVIFFSPSGFHTIYGYDKSCDQEIDEVVYSYINEAYDYCKKSHTYFFVVILGTVYTIYNPSKLENYFKVQSKDLLFEYNINNIYIMSKYIENLCIINNIPVLDLRNVVQRPHEFGEIYIDAIHFGPNGNILIAQELFKMVDIIYNNIKICERGKTGKDNIIYKPEQILIKSVSSQLKSWIESILALTSDIDASSKRIGSIVMNCNPFTNGHRYLIEQASQKCDYLYIFVVEEDKSFFKFKDRFNMVKEGTAQIPNVRVFKGGSFIISNLTFPQYFEKEENTQEEVNASEDLNVFAQFIAPALGIKVRFVGTEPYCKVTNEYNQQMMSILNRYGIETVLIDRRQHNGKAISATQVRNMFREKDIVGIQELVPITTYNYLINLLLETSNN